MFYNFLHIHTKPDLATKSRGFKIIVTAHTHYSFNLEKLLVWMDVVKWQSDKTKEYDKANKRWSAASSYLKTLSWRIKIEKLVLECENEGLENTYV